MKILPLEFKLKLNNETVGFELHEPNGINGKYIIYHRSKSDPNGWRSIFDHPECLIHHTQKCQWTGFKDCKGQKIYFGDILRYVFPNGTEKHYKVDTEYYCISANEINDKDCYMSDSNFENMELVED